MPGFVPSPDTLKVLLHWSLHGRPQLNVLHAHFPIVGPPDPAGVQRIFDAAAAAITTTGYVNVLHPVCSFTAVGMVDLRTEGVPEVRSTGTAVPGLSVARPWPDQTAFVVTLRTGKTGRSHRGRIYLMGWGGETIEDTGLVMASVGPIAVAWVTAVRNAMSGEGWRMAIRSPALPERPSKPGGTLPAKPYEITEVTAIEARDLIPDTNRRRTDLLRR